MIKYINIILVVLGPVLCSCNRDEEPPMETVLHISDTYMPCGVIFDKTDTDFLNICKEWNQKYFIVNSVDDLPEDPLGFNESYTNINFKEYSLLLAYRLHPWSIDTYRNRYVKDNVEQTYDWTISIGSSDFNNEDYDQLRMTRFAIEVKKLPEDAILKVWWGLTDLAFDWTAE